MTRDPFRINGPTCISFSGGRTSAYMLWRILESNAGLPADAMVCFANTGKEEEASLTFVDQCSAHWRVDINWLEYRDCDVGFARLNYQSASRNGEPFEALIRKRQYLPNPVARFCTSELKIRTMHRFLNGIGWSEWDQMIGIRADEMRRVAKIRARGHSTESAAETMLMPLADAGTTLSDVDRFWSVQPFRLELPTVNGRTLAGNCDLCFLKPANQLRTLIAQRPERALWWARMEMSVAPSKPDGARFYKGRTYAAMAANVADQTDAFGFEDEPIPCYCGE
jgi:3'-phosphoadenosine 5'-phosphosulfate sulfotransferase (PAPS reductase)/FAD synthetase